MSLDMLAYQKGMDEAIIKVTDLLSKYIDVIPQEFIDEVSEYHFGKTYEIEASLDGR